MKDEDKKQIYNDLSDFKEIVEKLSVDNCFDETKSILNEYDRYQVDGVYPYENDRSTDNLQTNEQVTKTRTDGSQNNM